MIHRSGYSLANLELDVPLDGTQVHRIGSVSKQFTAFAVLLLAEEGKVHLEEDIRVYLQNCGYGYRQYQCGARTYCRSGQYVSEVMMVRSRS